MKDAKLQSQKEEALTNKPSVPFRVPDTVNILCECHRRGNSLLQSHHTAAACGSRLTLGGRKGACRQALLNEWQRHALVRNWGHFKCSPAILLAESHIVPSTYHVTEIQVQALKIQLPGTAAHFHNAVTRKAGTGASLTK